MYRVALEVEINEALTFMKMGLSWEEAAKLVIKKRRLRKDEALFLGAYLKSEVLFSV